MSFSGSAIFFPLCGPYGVLYAMSNVMMHPGKSPQQDELEALPPVTNVPLSAAQLEVSFRTSKQGQPGKERHGLWISMPAVIAVVAFMSRGTRTFNTLSEHR
jgi:hypothetical protein